MNKSTGWRSANDQPQHAPPRPGCKLSRKRHWMCSLAPYGSDQCYSEDTEIAHRYRTRPATYLPKEIDMSKQLLLLLQLTGSPIPGPRESLKVKP